ncbi:MAG TPA: hypothetical protein VF458_19920 [Ktedonobacteraceae bacterium]
MQSPKEEGKQQFAAEPNPAPSPELSEAWRVLLGLQSTPAQEGETPLDPAAQVLPQASDPWNALLHVRGMESVDLQKIHLRELHPAASDEDIEHALNMIQEASNLPAPQEKKPGVE